MPASASILVVTGVASNPMVIMGLFASLIPTLPSSSFSFRAPSICASMNSPIFILSTSAHRSSSSSLSFLSILRSSSISSAPLTSRPASSPPPCLSVKMAAWMMSSCCITMSCRSLTFFLSFFTTALSSAGLDEAPNFAASSPSASEMMATQRSLSARSCEKSASDTFVLSQSIGMLNRAASTDSFWTLSSSSASVFLALEMYLWMTSYLSTRP
mmetsp:Transcript_840/g.1485  ORF Transcript_840/g.1485 Transcript_840/m.1485 type:complete len:214 (-) Transcript_840:115-756(-)